MRTDKDGKPGLRIETGASILAQDLIRDHLSIFSATIRSDHACGKAVHIEYVSGLSAVVALIIAGGQGSKEDVLDGTIAKLREYVDRDLQYLGRKP